MWNKIKIYGKLFLGLMIVYAGSFALFVILLFVLQQWFGIENNFYSEKRSQIGDMPMSSYLVFGVLLAPILEEIIFRNPLKRFTYRDFTLSLGVLLIFLSYNRLSFMMHPRISEVNFIQLLIGLIIVLVSLLVLKNRPVTENIKVKWSIILLVNIIFGFMHFKEILMNQDSYNLKFIVNGFVTIIPFTALGLYFTYIRIFYSLKLSILFHMIINSLSFISSYLV